MNLRRLAPVALAAVVLLGTTGCGLVSTQATTIPYSASDGVNIPPSGPLTVRNALLVTDKSGASANFLAAIAGLGSASQQGRANRTRTDGSRVPPN